MGFQRVIGRALVSCLVVASAGVVAIAGSQLARCDLQLEAIERARHGKAPVEPLGFWRRPPDVKPRLVEWATLVGTATLARRMIVNEPDQPSNVAARLVDAARALEVEPTSGRLWLSYADLAWQMRMPPDRIWPAIEMAQLAGRRESETMLVASLQVVRLWETASAARRDWAIETIAGMLRYVSAERKAGLAAALQRKTPELRAEIAARLAERLGKNKGWLKQVGL